MQWMRNRNVLVVAGIVLLAVAVAVVGMVLRPARNISDEPLSGAEAADGSATVADASLYLLVTAGYTTYAPILLDREDVRTLTQGEDTVNTIHVTPDGIWMEASTCENQDCVEQGMVTAENRQSRVLGNVIVCLPNRVQLELFTAEELREIGYLEAESNEGE